MPTDRQTSTDKRAQPSDDQPTSLNAEPSPSQILNHPAAAAAAETKPEPDTKRETKSGLGLWKILGGAVVALFVSTGFISAAIPKYKLLIKSPAIMKDNAYEVPAGIVTIRWILLKEQWFREVDISGVRANVSIKRYGEEKEDPYFDKPGELRLTLQAGTYEARIDAVDQPRSATVPLRVYNPSFRADHSSGYFRGSVEGKNGRKVEGAEVEVTEILGQPVLKTTTDNNGGFNIGNIPAPIGERVRVIVRVKGVEKYNEYWALPGPADIKLEK